MSPAKLVKLETPFTGTVNESSPLGYDSAEIKRQLAYVAKKSLLSEVHTQLVNKCQTSPASRLSPQQKQSFSVACDQLASLFASRVYHHGKIKLNNGLTDAEKLAVQLMEKALGNLKISFSDSALDVVLTETQSALNEMQVLWERKEKDIYPDYLSPRTTIRSPVDLGTTLASAEECIRTKLKNRMG